MQETSESYTTAQLQLLKNKKKEMQKPDSAALAGVSDAAVRAKTGCNWQQWVRHLDAKGAASMSHREIAKCVHEQFDISGWWAQTVTVGYERIKGLREIGQRRGGTYEASKSKTLPVPIAQLYRAFTVAQTRRRWLPNVKFKTRTTTPEKSMRVTWPDGTSVEFSFTAKGKSKSQVVVQHRKLATKSDVAKMKKFWGDSLAALAEIMV